MATRSTEDDDMKGKAEDIQLTVKLGKKRKSALSEYCDSLSVTTSMNSVVQRAVDEFLSRQIPAIDFPAPDQLGLFSIVAPANDRDSTTRLANADQVDLVFNDMKSWLPGPPESRVKHLSVIRDRVRSRKVTRIWLLHPESPMITEVSRASQKDPQAQIDEIERAVMRICGEDLWDVARQPSTIFEERTLQIVGHPRYNTYSMIRFDDEMWVNYYPITSRGSGDTGQFHIYRKTSNPLGIFSRLMNDLGNTTAKATEDFPETFDLVSYYFRKNVKNRGAPA